MIELDGFGRCISIVLVISLFFLSIMNLYEKKSRKMQDIYIREVADAYVDKIAENKKILLSEWESFNSEIKKYGTLFETELVEAVIKEIPLKESETMGEWCRMKYHSEIVRELYQNGKYEPEPGAYIIMKVNVMRTGGKRVCFERARKID